MNKNRDKQILEALEKGKSPQELSEKYGLTRARIYMIAKRLGFSFPRDVEILRDKINLIVSDAVTMTPTQLATKYDVSYTVMYRFLREQGIGAARTRRKRVGTYGVKGKRFGFWVVVNDTRHKNAGIRSVLARCDCGKERIIPLKNLENGFTKSCRSCSAKRWHKEKRESK